MPERPKCPDCELDLVCKSCDDTRPKAEELYPGWTLRTPFQRWETVERVEPVSNYGPVRVWTKESGPIFAWTYRRWDQVDAHPPLQVRPGKPEVRILDDGRGDIRMYAIAILDTAQVGGWGVPKAPSVLVEAGAGGRGNGWWVVNTAGSHYENGWPAEKYEGLSKAQARSKLRELARAHAKALKVKVTLPVK